MTNFSSIYPNIAAWTESYGWIEIGQGERNPNPSSAFWIVAECVGKANCGRFLVRYNLSRH
jgi:hypothetical protein